MPVITPYGPQGQNAAVSQAFTAGSASLMGPFATARSLELTPTANCRIAVGDSSVVATASGMLILAGIQRIVAIQKGQYISVIGDLGAGTLEAHPVNVA